MLSWTIFRRYFFSRRAGALVKSLARLCLIANFISVLALVLVLSIMNGFRDAQEDKLLSVEPHLVIAGENAQEALQTFLGSDSSRLNANQIVDLAPYEKQDVIVRTIDGLFSGGVAKGLSAASLRQLFARAKIESTSLQAGEVIMGAELARNLGVYEGDEVVFMAPEGLLLPAGEIPPYEKVRVRTILATDIADLDAQMIFYDQELTLSRLKQTGSYETGVEVRLQNPQDAGYWQDVLAQNSFQVSTWGERNSALFFALKMEKYAMTTFLCLSILITCFSLFTVLIMLITQKRKDIGLLMALGLSKRKTQRLFVFVGVLLSFSGMMMGLLIGVFIAGFLGHFSIPLLPDIYVDSRLPARVDWVQISFIALALLILGLLAAYWPVRSSLDLTPSESLRGRK